MASSSASNRQKSAPTLRRTGRFPLGYVMTRDPNDTRPELDTDQLAELDRLRTASLLSAGLAHEVANPLLAVLANLAEIERIYPRLRASMGGSEVERWESLADCLDQAHRSADAIADVIRDFQVFLRPASNRVERLVDPGPLVERAVRMVSPRLRVSSALRTNLSKTPYVKAPPSLITQITLNLLTNATEALAGTDAQTNLIEVRLNHEGSNVVLEVEDNGPGLSPEAAATVFEPHVTSKTTGSSLGLGLSICRALVERFGGSISVDSVPNERTVFCVTLPVAETQPPA
jgi:two-component system, NtrC family, sensor kinase